MKCRLLISLLLSLPILFAASAPEVQPVDPWRQGKAAEKAGDYVKALNIWESARDSLVSAGTKSDPRIGFDYIELVTREKMRDRYRTAGEMVYWGLSGPCTDAHKEVLASELERIKPIISGREYKQWRSYLDGDLSALCREFGKFWKQLDPTITTGYNERLIEHWERIAYARKNFRKNKSSVYGADDRAIIYVKLGEPDIKKAGSLTFSQPLVRSWVNDIIDRQFRGGGSITSSGSDSSGSAGDAVGANSEASPAQQSANQMWARVDMADRFTKQAELLHRYQRYEVWIYHEKLANNEDNLVYIFGQDGETSSFGLRRSLDEMIPGRAFRSQSAHGSLLRPGLLLQLMYYQQLMHVDNYFADVFSDLETRIMVTNGLNPSTSQIVRDQNTHKLSYIQVRAPEQKSRYLEEIPDVELAAYQYRFLDGENRPYLATYLEGKPQKALFLDQVNTNSFDADKYKLNFNARLTNATHTTLFEGSKASKINTSGRGKVKDMNASTAYFKLPHYAKDTNQRFAAELQKGNRESASIGDKAFSEALRAIGMTQVHQPERLKTAPGELEMSDIILGINPGADGGAGEAPGPGSGPVSFSVRNERSVPQGKNLRIYFEVYHLQSGTGQSNQFRVEYRISSKGKNIFQRLFGKKDNEVGLILNFETAETYHRSDLEIVTSAFDAGNYELSLRAFEPNTGREVERKLEFKIIE